MSDYFFYWIVYFSFQLIVNNFVGFALLAREAFAISQLSHEQKAVFYQDCSVFNKSELYGGEICGNNGVTYANSLVLDCINHQQLSFPGKCENFAFQTIRAFIKR